jgi:hypothetical protein
MGGSDAFPCPFDDVASLHMPETIPLALRWSEFLVSSDGLYMRAIDRVLSYFITDLELSGLGDDEQEEWSEYLNDTLDMKNVLHTVGMDAAVYGNSFNSVLPKFSRFLACPQCHVEHPLRLVFNTPDFRFQWSGFQFNAFCPRCSFSGVWQRIDRRSPEKNRCRIKRWNPHDIDILWDPMTDDTRYIWRIPEDYRRQVREGHLFHLERVPWEVVEAVRDNRHLLFDDGFIYHMREDALAGVRNRGWGISRVLANFRQAWYVQVLRRYNEAIALDYVIPFRLITPPPGDKSGAGDPLNGTNMGNTFGRIRHMIKEHRRDPSSWHFLPFPVQYQTLGGEAKQLAPVDLLNQGMEVLLNNIGIPAEMYKGSLQIQAAPVALRLFESTWSTLPHNLNGFVRFVVEAVARIMSWEEVDARLQRVSHADDVTRQQAKLQLMMSGQVSPSSGLEAVGLKYRDEVRRTVQDQRYQAEQTAKMQQDMDAAAGMQQMTAPPQPGGAPGGAPGGPQGAPQPGGGQPGQGTPQGQAAGQMAGQAVVGPDQKITLTELYEQANQQANQLMAMGPSERSSALRKLRQSNPGIHPFVLQRIEALRDEAARKGQAAVLSQQFGAQH